MRTRAWILAFALLAPAGSSLQAIQASPPLDRGRLRPESSTPELPVLRLSLPKASMQQISSRRDRALFENQNFSDQAFWSKGEAEVDGKTSKIDLRLKGDMIDHWSDLKLWSFRIKMKDDGAFLGMTVFSVQRPMTRHGLWEWVLSRALQREHLLAARYAFTRLFVNGRDYGIYAVEDGMPKSTLDLQGFHEGPILKFDEASIWESQRTVIRQQRNWPDESAWNCYYRPAIEAVGMSSIKADKVQTALFEAALDRFELYRRQQVRGSDVFHARRTARYAALMDLFGADHALSTTNIRIYYDPLTAKFEPVGFDMAPAQDLKVNTLERLRRSGRGERSHAGADTLFGNLTRDPVVHEAYLEELRRVAAPEYLEQLRKDLEPEYSRLVSALELQNDEIPNWELAARNQLKIRELLANLEARDYVGTHPLEFSAAILGVHGSEVTLRLQSFNPAALMIDKAELGQGREAVALEGSYLLPGSAYPDAPPSPKTVTFRLPPGREWDPKWNYQFTLQAQRPGGRLHFMEDAFPWVERFQSTLLSPLLFPQRPGAAEPWVAGGEGWTLAAGTHRLAKTAFIPAGSVLRFMPGAVLVLADGASLISYSPLDWSGSEQAPIIVRSDKGGGVAVLDAASQSRLSYVRFEGLDAPSFAETHFTGGVTFYRSDLKAQHCSWSHARSEDALNIISSGLQMEASSFEDVFSDALDGDFIQGSIRHSSFKRSGNDAIDVSGSRLEIEDVDIEAAGDKGVSVGEASAVTGKRIRITGSEIALASKDGSSLKAGQLSLEGCKLGVTVYRKKKFFPPATAELSALSQSRVSTLHLVENGSRLTLDGKALESDQDQVKARLYGNEFGKESKR